MNTAQATRLAEIRELGYEREWWRHGPGMCVIARYQRKFGPGTFDVTIGTDGKYMRTGNRDETRKVMV